MLAHELAPRGTLRKHSLSIRILETLIVQYNELQDYHQDVEAYTYMCAVLRAEVKAALKAFDSWFHEEFDVVHEFSSPEHTDKERFEGDLYRLNDYVNYVLDRYPLATDTVKSGTVWKKVPMSWEIVE